MSATHAIAVFNVRDYGASAKKEDNAQPAIQQAIDACAAAGGGMVYFPPGDYTSGTIHLRSHVRVHIEAGATIYSSKEPQAFDKRSLFYGEDLEHITLEGRGVVDGQAEYEWRPRGDFHDWYIYPNQIEMEEAGLPLLRAFPTANSVGHLIVLVRCKDVHVTGISLIRSPSWTFHPFACERLVIDGIYIRTSQETGVWADGIDPDGCKDVIITNCTVETGDDAIVFYSSSIYGPPQPCENITITNCRLSSASSAIKFCDGNMNAIRNVTIDNCVITSSNRGIAFMVFDGGIVENVILSNLTVECKRFDWFWWGSGDPLHFNLIQRSEIDANVDKSKEPPVGAIRNVIVRNVLARGSGTSLLHGHKDSPLENITLENVRIAIAQDPHPHPRRVIHAVKLENARNFKLKDFEVIWDTPYSEQWQSALLAQNVQDLTLDGFSARTAPKGAALRLVRSELSEASAPAVILKDIEGAVIQHCKAQAGTGTFLGLSGSRTRDIVLLDNDLRQAGTSVTQSDEVKPDALRENG